jgi:hypothetical protein
LVRFAAQAFKGSWSFRSALLSSTVCNDPAAYELAAKAEREGDWTVLMAIDAAKRAGKDWRPAVAEARRRMAEDANRLRARCIPRVGSVADFVRWNDLAGDGR